MLDGDFSTAKVILTQMGFSRFLDLEADFEEPELHYLAVRMEEFDTMRLFRRLFIYDPPLRVWEISLPGDSTPLGYATWYITVHRVPGVTVFFFDGEFRQSVAEAVLEAIVHETFERAENDWVHGIDFLMLRPAPPQFAAYLTGSGFDPRDWANIDSEIEVCYSLRRDTYRAYQQHRSSGDP